VKVILLFAAAVAITLLPRYAEVPMIQNVSSDAKVDGSHDFDFLFGRWKNLGSELDHGVHSYLKRFGFRVSASICGSHSRSYFEPAVGPFSEDEQCWLVGLR
jgi:hypothetical protein